MRWLAVVAVTLAGCASTADSRPAVASAPPAALSPAAPAVALASCDATEYFVQRDRPAEARFRVRVDDNGRAADVKLVRSAGLLPEELLPALDVARHLFRCRNRLAPEASCMTSYMLRFANVERPEIDRLACGRAAEYPRQARASGTEAQVRVGVALDDRGRVDLAWVDHPSEHGFASAAIDALSHRCRFAPARLNGQPVPFFLVYTFMFVIP